MVMMPILTTSVIVHLQSPSTPWSKVILDGFAGGFVGALFAFIAAVVVIERQRKDIARQVDESRAVAIAQQKETAAVRLADILSDCWTILTTADEAFVPRMKARKNVIAKLPLALAIATSISVSVWHTVDDIITSAHQVVSQTTVAEFNDILADRITEALTTTTEYLNATEH